MRISSIALLPFALICSAAMADSGLIPTFRELAERSRASSPELQLSRLEALAQISESRVAFGALLPELGVEGGARSNREREKRNDLFYYGYGRLEISLKEIFELRTALHRKDVALLERNQVEGRTELILAELFYSTLLLQGQVTLKRQDLELTEKQIIDAKKRVEGGVATETDLLEFAMHQQEKRNDLESLESELQRQYRELERFTGISEKISELKSDPVKPIQLRSFDEIWTRVKEHNIELRRARSDAVAAQSDKAAALGRYLPKFSAEAQYGKLMETDFVESKRNSWAVVGKVTVPIFNGLSDFNRFQSKSYEADKATIAEIQTEAKIRNKTQNLMIMVESLEKKLDGEQKNVQTAERYYKAIVSEYKRGVKNSPDMAGATDKLFEAKLRALEADRDLSIATMELLAIQGLSIQDL